MNELRFERFDIKQRKTKRILWPLHAPPYLIDPNLRHSLCFRQDYCLAGSMDENGLMSPDHEHFPSFEDRARSSTRHVTRSGRAVSPAHSAHGVLIRASLIQKQAKKAKKVRFYRNGDRFFKGMAYAVSIERFRTFESLLAELTNSPLCDKNIMPNGVRAIFSIDGSRKISSIDEMEEEESYVCASTQVFKKVAYPKHQIPNWSFNMKTHIEQGHHRLEDCEDNREFIRPKLVTVIRNGSRPRKAVRVLLNKKTAHSLDQVLNDINDAIKLDTGSVKKIFTIDGKPVSWCVWQADKDNDVNKQ